MEPDMSLMGTPINSNKFPAKLWRIVNSPFYQSIYWDSDGYAFIIEQLQFEYELLSPPRTSNNAAKLFKTKNFQSFIRQLNLYGFKKIFPVFGSKVHYFCNENFQKDRPDLLIHLKRLTSINKAKMAAAIEENSRPPSRFQLFLTSVDTDGSKEDDTNKGLMTVQQSHSTGRRENISSYTCVNPSSHTDFPENELDAPMLPSPWSNSFGLHQSQLTSYSSFSQNEMFYPVLRRFPSDITYTMQSTATTVHVQQSQSDMPGSIQSYSGYIPYTAEYPQVYYPSAVPPCYITPAHLPHFSSGPGPAVSSYQNYSYFQEPPMHPSYPMDFFHTNCPSKKEMNVEPVFLFSDVLQSPQRETVKLNPVESLQKPALSSLQNENATMEMSPGNDEVDVTTYSDEDNILCADEGDRLASNVTSSSQMADCEYKDNSSGMQNLEQSADFNLLAEVACEQLAKKN